MDNPEILKSIYKAIESNKDENGWVDLALLGNTLISNGFNYKALGYFKLRELIEEFPDELEVRVDDSSFKVPVVYVKKIGANISTQIRTVKKSPKIHREKHGIPSNLLSWAWMGDFTDVIHSLKKIALDERWYYKTQNPAYPYPILTKYLKYTFFRLSKEKNKIKYNEQYAAFNTGLVNNLYEPIFALFEKNRIKDRQEWYFHEFCVAGVGKAGKTITRNFNPLPERATFFESPSELIYDTTAPEPQLNWNHIILDNVERLPIDFLEENKPDGFLFKDTSNFNTVDKKHYYESLSQAIQDDSKVFRAIKNRFSDSLSLALKRVNWNFKTAIPMYYPPLNKMSLLLPLSLIDDEYIDLALVVEKTKSGNYLGHTVLPLSWAYSNARLITRPDSDWLVAEDIDTGIDSEDEDE